MYNISMYKELTPQSDLWDKEHLPQPIITERTVERIISQTHPSRIQELHEVDFVEFEDFVETPSALIGLDFDLDNKPNLKMLCALEPWQKPTSEIYYLKGNIDAPSSINRYIPTGQNVRRRSDIKKIFFSLMYPKKGIMHLEELEPHQVLDLANHHPIISNLNYAYFY